MNSLYDFIVKPIGEGRYNNSKKIGEKELILNTKIESWKFVNRFAKVVSTPLAITTNIKKGDIIVVHQNVFRRFYNMKGKQTNSRSFFKNDLYFVSSDQIYLYKNKGEWQSFGDRCFVKPIKNKDKFNLGIEHSSKGVVKYTDGCFKKNKLIGFNPRVNHEFIIDNELLYKIPNENIEILYEYQGDEETYNPSWA